MFLRTRLMSCTYFCVQNTHSPNWKIGITGRFLNIKHLNGPYLFDEISAVYDEHTISRSENSLCKQYENGH